MADLTTLEAVKSYLQIDAGDTSSDAIMASLISSESARFSSLSGNPILRAQDAWTTDGNGTRYLLPRLSWSRYPLVSVDSLTVDGVSVPASVNGGLGFVTANGRVELIGYVFSGTYSMPRFDGSTRGVANVVLTYTAGYAAAPAEVAQAVNEMVALKMAGRTRVGLASQSVGGESASFQANPWAEIQSVIDAYTRPVL